MKKWWTNKENKQPVNDEESKLKDFKLLDYQDSDKLLEDTLLQRCGRVLFSVEMLQQNPVLAKEVLSNILMVHIEQDAINGIVNFMGYSMDFDITPAKLPSNTPVYKCEIAQKEVDGKMEYYYNMVKEYDEIGSNAVH